MFIVHGTTVKRKKLGLVADFCPICHAIRPFELRRIGVASHLYFISFGQGKLKGHTIDCLVCGISLVTNPLTYEKMEENRTHAHDVEGLIQTTFPRLRQVYAERLAFEEQLRKSPTSLPADVRAKYIREPFSLINPSVEAHYKENTQLDKQSGIGCAGTIVVTIGLIVFALKWLNSSPHQQEFMYTALGVAILGAIYTFIQMGLGPGRYLRGNLMPKLAVGLSPLEPTREELTAVLEKCKAAGMLIGKKVKPDRLLAELVKMTVDAALVRGR